MNAVYPPRLINRELSPEDRCPACKGTQIIYDSNRSELVCDMCGVVVREGKDLALNSEFVAQLQLHERSFSLPTNALQDQGLSTMIPSTNLDARGSLIEGTQRNSIYRLRRLDRFAAASSRQRTLRTASYLLNSIRDKLSLTDAVIQKSAYNFRKAFDQHMTKGRSIRGLLVASAYIACRQSSVPRTIDEIAAAASTDPVFASKCYRLLIRKLKLNPPRLEPTACLSRVVNALAISERSYRQAIELLEAIKDHHIVQGKNPRVLAMASLYTSCAIDGEQNITLAKIANAGEVSVLSLRKRVADINKIRQSRDGVSADSRIECGQRIGM